MSCVSKPWEPLTDDEIAELPSELIATLRPPIKELPSHQYIESPMQSLTMTPRKFRFLWQANE